MSDSKEIDILLVDDSPHDVELTLRALKKHHILNHVQVVRDGAEALDYLFGRGVYGGRDMKQQPKLVLLDIKLPKVSGLEVLAWIKGNSELKKIPVVMLTSSKEEFDIHKSYDLGANSYIVKPVDFEKFVDIVSNLGLYWLLLNQPD